MSVIEYAIFCERFVFAIGSVKKRIPLLGTATVSSQFIKLVRRSQILQNGLS